MLEPIPVSSSMIREASYNGEQQELHITFKQGSRWTYSGVPQDVADGFASASSVGQFFLSEIKGRFAERRG